MVISMFCCLTVQAYHILISDSDLESIYNTLDEARQVKDKPTIIRLRTIIGYGSKHQGTHGIHGSRKS